MATDQAVGMRRRCWFRPRSTRWGCDGTTGSGHHHAHRGDATALLVPATTTGKDGGREGGRGGEWIKPEIRSRSVGMRRHCWFRPPPPPAPPLPRWGARARRHRAWRAGEYIAARVGASERRWNGRGGGIMADLCRNLARNSAWYWFAGWLDGGLSTQETGINWLTVSEATWESDFFFDSSTIGYHFLGQFWVVRCQVSVVGGPL